MLVNHDLLQAAENGDLANLQSALDQDANVNAQDGSRQTALMLAAGKGYTEIVGALLDQEGIQVNAPDLLGQTALMWAVKQGHEAIVRALLAKGADVNAQDKDGNTALKLAFGRSIGDKKVVPEIVDLLLRHKARPKDEETATRLKEYRTWRFLDRAGKMLMGAGLVGVGLIFGLGYVLPALSFGMKLTVSIASAGTVLFVGFGIGHVQAAHKMQVQTSTSPVIADGAFLVGEKSEMQVSKDPSSSEIPKDSETSENRQRSKSI